MVMETPDVVAPLDQEIVLITLTTLVRLFDLNPDAALLYLFYCKTAKLQSNVIGYTNQIKASRSYTRKGLSWGTDKYHQAKKILTQHNFIEDIKKVDNEGRTIGWYIRLHYLINPNDGYVLDKTGGVSSTRHLQVSQNLHVGFETTNAEDEKKNAGDEKIIGLTPITIGHTVPNADSNPHYRPLISHSNPVSEKEVWQIARELEVAYERVLQKQQALLDAEQEGAVYIKNMFQTLRKWVRNGLAWHEFGRLSSVEKMAQNQYYDMFLKMHPEEKQ